MTRRPVITGIGVISPLGVGARHTLGALGRGQCARVPPSVFDARGFAQPLGGEIRDFAARDHFKVAKALKITDRATRFAVAAARLALGEAEWTDDDGSRERLGVLVGCSGSDLQASELGRALHGVVPDQVHDIPVFADRVLNGVNPLWLLINLPNMASAHVAIQAEARGPNSTVMSDWAAGVQAIGEAVGWVRASEADAVLAGGADSGLTPFAYAAFEQAGLFAGGDPYVPAEGAALLLIEDEEHARARGALVRGEVLGYGSAVAGHEDPEAGAEALGTTMRQAASQAEWNARDIGTALVATPSASWLAGAPALALRAAFGRYASSIGISTFEPQLGHALAAAAPLDLALTLASGARADRAGILCSAITLSGHAVTVAVRACEPSSSTRPS